MEKTDGSTDHTPGLSPANRGLRRALVLDPSELVHALGFIGGMLGAVIGMVAAIVVSWSGGLLSIILGGVIGLLAGGSIGIVAGGTVASVIGVLRGVTPEKLRR
ncbi:hypothetical protein EDE05_106144 [Neorhizobium sp. R1-B]|nr:hypothetical protein EDE05_106144 [Neorhizobium sp. R1-B]